MILAAMVAALAIAPSGFKTSLAWADRLYRKCAEQPFTLGPYEYSALLDAYSGIIRKFGPRPAALLGIARCVARSGKVELAAIHYRALPPQACGATERQEAIDAGEVARRLHGKGGRRQVIQVARVPGNGGRLWAVLWAQRHVPDDDDPIQSDSGPSWRLYEDYVRSGELRPVGKPHDCRAWESESRIGHLVATTLDGGRLPCVIVDVLGMAGDSEPHKLFIYAIRNHRADPIVTFDTIEHPLIHRGRHGDLVLSLSKTWKVYWPDQMEWRHGRFRLANERYPEFYCEEAQWLKRWSASIHDDYVYPLFAASLDMVNGRRVQALRHLRTAERLCRKSLYYESHPSERPTEFGFHRYGFTGSTGENPREIRQRIRWIKTGDLNHALLYRPYDFDLQIPPYELGRSLERQNE